MGYEYEICLDQRNPNNIQSRERRMKHYVFFIILSPKFSRIPSHAFEPPVTFVQNLVVPDGRVGWRLRRVRYLQYNIRICYLALGLEYFRLHLLWDVFAYIMVIRNGGQRVRRWRSRHVAYWRLRIQGEKFCCKFRIGTHWVTRGSERYWLASRGRSMHLGMAS